MQISGGLDRRGGLCAADQIGRRRPSDEQKPGGSWRPVSGPVPRGLRLGRSKQKSEATRAEGGFQGPSPRGASRPGGHCSRLAPSVAMRDPGHPDLAMVSTGCSREQFLPSFVRIIWRARTGPHPPDVTQSPQKGGCATRASLPSVLAMAWRVLLASFAAIHSSSRSAGASVRYAIVQASPKALK